MTTTIELPDGVGTATIRDPKSVTEAQRRPVTRLQMRLAVSPVGQLLARKAAAVEAKDDAESAKVDAELGEFIGNDLGALELLDDLNDALIVALVETFNGAPLTSATDLPGPAYDQLKTEAAKHISELMPGFSPNPDPSSPTPPSAN